MFIKFCHISSNINNDSVLKPHQLIWSILISIFDIFLLLLLICVCLARGLLISVHPSPCGGLALARQMVIQGSPYAAPALLPVSLAAPVRSEEERGMVGKPGNG